MKCESRFNLYSNQVLGPIVVDTSPPEINGEVSLRASEAGLVVQWLIEDISDPEDPDISVYIAIGKAFAFISFIYNYNNYNYLHFLYPFNVQLWSCCCLSGWLVPHLSEVYEIKL